MIEISISDINSNLIVYGTVILIIYLGIKLHISWIDVSQKITRKKFFWRWMICLLLDIIVYLIIVFSKVFENHNILVYDSMRNLGAILIIFYESLAISSIIQRCRCMIHSKFFMIVMMLLWIFNGFFKIVANPSLLMIILVMGMMPDKNNSKEERQE
jgi:hypothetical protein